MEVDKEIMFELHRGFVLIKNIAAFHFHNPNHIAEIIINADKYGEQILKILEADLKGVKNANPDTN